jgi:hypothetical protein
MSTPLPSQSLYVNEVAKLVGHVYEALDDLSNTHIAVQVLPYLVEISHRSNDFRSHDVNLLVSNVNESDATRILVRYTYAKDLHDTHSDSPEKTIKVVYVGGYDTDVTFVAQSVGFSLVVNAVKNGFTAIEAEHQLR